MSPVGNDFLTGLVGCRYGPQGLRRVLSLSTSEFLSCQYEVDITLLENPGPLPYHFSLALNMTWPSQG